MSNKIKYIIVCLGLTAVITASLFLPQKVAVWQDNNRLGVVKTQTIDPFAQSGSGGNEIIDSLRFLQDYRRNGSSDSVNYMEDSSRWSREEIVEQYYVEMKKLAGLHAIGETMSNAVEDAMSSLQTLDIDARLYVNKSAGQARIYWSVFSANGIETLVDDITGKIVSLRYKSRESYTTIDNNTAIIEAWAEYFGLEFKAASPETAEAYHALSPYIEAVLLANKEESVEYLFYFDPYYCVIGIFDIDFLHMQDKNDSLDEEIF